MKGLPLLARGLLPCLRVRARRRCLSFAVTAVAFVASFTGAGSRAAAQQPAVQDVSIGVMGESTSWFAGTKWHHAIELASRLTFVGASASEGPRHALPIAMVAGVRAGFTTALAVPFEVFARLELTGRAGKYLEPSCGPEIGLSGLTEPDAPADGMPAGVSALQRERAGPVYFAFVATPLRVRLGPLRLVAGDFRLGSTFAGSAAVFGIGYLRAEYRL